jgi:lysophospholipase L1-like esterase
MGFRRTGVNLLALGWMAALSTFLHADLPAAGTGVAFLGDTVTQGGLQHPNGFVHLVEMAFAQQDHAIRVIPASGDYTSRDMLAHFPSDVISKKPGWVVLSCGIADVSRGGGGVPLDLYKRNITSILEEAKAADIQVILLTAAMITEDPANPLNEKLAPYNDFLRALAKQKGLPLADVNADMQAMIQKIHAETQQPGNVLTTDGTHFNGVGDEMMAGDILRAFGFTDAQLAQARDLWLDLTGGMLIQPQSAISVRQYLQLRALATREGISVDALISDTLNNELRDLLLTPASKKAAGGKNGSKNVKKPTLGN